MATPTTAERRLLAAGAKKASTWGTAVALGAGNEIKIGSMAGMVMSRDYSPGKYADTPFVSMGALTDVKPPDVTLGFDHYYDPGALGVLMALLFGTAGAPSQQGGTTAYKHTLQWADLATGLFATLCAEFPGKIYEVASFKPLSLGFKVGDGRIKGELKGRGNTVIDTSATNTATQIDALTWVGQDAPALFAHASIKINGESAGDVTAATALECSGFDLDFARGLDAQLVAGSQTIIEPAESGFPEVKLKLDFPRMNATNAAFLATMIAETTQKALITLTSPLEAGTAYPYSWKFFFPRLRIVGNPPSWDEIVKNGLELVAEAAAAAPTGMSYTRPYIEIINKQSTNYLA